ncbi:MAG TPA: hypothetical protein VGN88_09950 [Phycisphaerae bacterium]
MRAGPTAAQQVPTWSNEDMQFYLHGSMSTEVIPETMLRAFIATYPDMFPSKDFSHIGAIPDTAFGWPVGFTRANPAHLASLPSVGINCAACHTAQISSPGMPDVRVLGTAAVFDAEAFFGSIVISTFRTEDPGNMQKFLGNYIDESDPEPDATKRAQRRAQFDAAWQKQSAAITAAMSADAAGAKGAGPGSLQNLTPADFRLAAGQITGGGVTDTAIGQLAVNSLKLFHNIRAALHVPDQPPAKAPPLSGPGRNDAFGLLSAALFDSPQPFAPVKYGIVWNIENRHFVHWDGNTRSPLARNLLAAVGLGAPLIGNHANLRFDLIARHTNLTEKIHAPRYPYPVDLTAAARGKPTYESTCLACHDGVESDKRLYSPDDVKTDPVRAKLFNQIQADKFNNFLAKLETPGYTPPAEPGIRSTGKYFSPSLAGVWARSPYLHNGSVRTMDQLLSPPASRQTTFHRGSTTFDPVHMGYTDEGTYLLDTQTPASNNSGHDYGTHLSPTQKSDLIEYLKTL